MRRTPPVYMAAAGSISMIDHPTSSPVAAGGRLTDERIAQIISDFRGDSRPSDWPPITNGEVLKMFVELQEIRGALTAGQLFTSKWQLASRQPIGGWYITHRLHEDGYNLSERIQDDEWADCHGATTVTHSTLLPPTHFLPHDFTWAVKEFKRQGAVQERRASSPPADPTTVEAALRTIATGKVPERKWLSLIECIEDFAKSALGILEPWKRCPSTHCNRRGKCASPSDCTVKSPVVPSPPAGRDEIIALIGGAPDPFSYTSDALGRGQFFKDYREWKDKAATAIPALKEQP